MREVGRRLADTTAHCDSEAERPRAVLTTAEELARPPVRDAGFNGFNLNPMKRVESSRFGALSLEIDSREEKATKQACNRYNWYLRCAQLL